MERPDHRVGVFDTLLVQDGAPVALEAHVLRLVTSVRDVYGVPLDEAALAQAVSARATHGPRLQRVRVVFTPGAGVSVEAEPLAERPRGPWHLLVRRVPGGWGAHKWCDRSLLREWGDPADPSVDPLLVDEDDQLLESGRGNVFVVRDGEVVTPPLDGRILPGVTREAVLGILAGLDIPCRAGPVPLAVLATAAEVFVTSSIGGVRPAATCDVGGPWATGPVTRTVDEALERAWAGRRDEP
jgi:para-aminobenzoate synthetase/4-amino-4-deoxychorismate lyase